MSVYGCHMNLELQQRAVEYNAVLRKHDVLRDGLFEQMPPIELKPSYANNSSSNLGDVEEGVANGVVDTSEQVKRREHDKIKEEAVKTLIDIFSDDVPVIPQPDKPAAVNSDLDILGFLDQPKPSAGVKPSSGQNDLDSLFSNTPSVNTLPRPTTTTNPLEDLLGSP